MHEFDKQFLELMQRTSAMGTQHTVTTDCFREARFHWQLSGDKFEEVTGATVPIPDLRWSGVPMAGFGLLLSFRAYTESELFGLNCRWA